MVEYTVTREINRQRDMDNDESEMEKKEKT